MVRTIQYFKDRFQVGYKITQADYYDWLDSFIHAATGITVSNISDLGATLANYRLKNVNIPASEIDGLSAAISSLTTNFLTTSSTINQSQITGLVTALSNCTTVTQVQNMINTAINALVLDNAPSIGGNGNWFIGSTDTGVPAQGQDGQSVFIGSNGNWYIGDPNGTPPGTDTGISASGGASGFNLFTEYTGTGVVMLKLNWNDAQGNPQEDGVNIGLFIAAYLDDVWQTDNGSLIGGAIDGTNRIFYPSVSFRHKTFRVFRDGRKMRMGSDKDYIITTDTSNVQCIKFNYNIPVDTALEFEYLRVSF